jgi:hypothetical protein
VQQKRRGQRQAVPAALMPRFAPAQLPQPHPRRPIQRGQPTTKRAIVWRWLAVLPDLQRMNDDDTSVARIIADRMPDGA